MNPHESSADDTDEHGLEKKEKQNLRESTQSVDKNHTQSADDTDEHGLEEKEKQNLRESAQSADKNHTQSADRDPPSRTKKDRTPERSTVVECMILIGLTAVVSLVANSVNANGIHLSRNYFAKGIVASRPTKPTTRAAATPDGSARKPDPGGDEPTTNDWGIQVISLDRAVKWHQADETAAGAYVWVDARKADLYEDGHIPGAHLCNHYKVDQYLPALLGTLQAAEKIIVYCGGGDCEDSNQLATYLIQEAGLDFARIYVYEQGWEGWEEKGLPKKEGNQP